MSSKPSDMRSGIDGLMAIVRNEWKSDIFSGHLFVFYGHSRKLIKILHWDRGGLFLHSKRLEKGQFKKPRLAPDCQSIELDSVELTLLLDGISVSEVRRPKLWEPPKQPLKNSSRQEI
jgi:transposase